jgi:hypothetical protein
LARTLQIITANPKTCKTYELGSENKGNSKQTIYKRI